MKGPGMRIKSSSGSGQSMLGNMQTNSRVRERPNKVSGENSDIFTANNITGENLLDLDQAMLKEIGVNKIGDRVRISSQAKQFRQDEYRRRQPRHRVYKDKQRRSTSTDDVARTP